MLPGARPEFHIFSPTEIALLQGSTTMGTAVNAAAAAVNGRLDTRDRVNARPDAVWSRLLKPVPHMYLVRR